MSTLAASVRGLVAVAVLAALATDAVTAVREGLLAQNVSYFTNQSNLMFVVTVVLAPFLRGRRPARWDDVRGAVAFYLVMTAIIHAVLIAPMDDLLRWDIGWTGIVLHRLAPMVALADWVLTPRTAPGHARRILWWQLYPVVFLAVTWIRGGITTWYPYEFLDPTASSWSAVLTTTLVVLVAFFAVAAALHLIGGLGRRRGARGKDRSPRPESVSEV